MWDGQEWQTVKWYNKGVGIQTLYTPGDMVTPTCDSKIPLKNSINLMEQSVIRGFSLESFSEYSAIYSDTTDYCGQGNVLGGDCYQHYNETQFIQFPSAGNINYVDTALNMPVKRQNDQIRQSIDQMQGWSTQFINAYDLELIGGAKFFDTADGDTFDTDPIIANMYTWIRADQTAYMNTVLPSNGTTEWPTGEHTEDQITYINHPRLPGEKVGITALVVLTAVALVMILVFLKFLFEGDNSAQKVAYHQTSETDGLVDSDP